ncbi:MAG: M20 family metallopeptidase [Anaerolineae bacterium]|nr:M20 family metallopeptidase [Anaerolineae bacterium]
MSRLLDYMLARQEAMTRTLEQWVMLESPSNEPEAVNALRDLVARAFKEAGATVKRLRQAAFGDHLRISWGQGDRQLLLLGHMDTVWPLGEVQHRPFRVSQDKATGPGIFDMKGGLVIALYAVMALQELGLKPAHRLVFLFNSDEEVGSLTSRPFIEAESRRSEAVLVLEPSRNNALVTWRKGVGRFELEVQGVASHAGAAHEQGVSAVQELAHQVLRLEAMTDYGRGTTVNVGVVEGGSKVNVRPASAWAAIDLRVLTAEEGRRMTEAILELQPANPEATLIISGGMNRPPWEASPASDALFERARRVGAALGLDLWPAGTGGGSDGNFAAALGVPTLDGLGAVGNDAHALTEWVDLTSLPRRAALLAELVIELGQ